ncbi:MAG: MerC domain-containing protein [Bacteroidetes bacterium]|nr:MerC domain-containing protein [Fibrella sp.]
MKFDFLDKKADYIGIIGSVLCILHCLITPVLIMTSTMLKDDLVRTSVLGLDYLFIGVNMVAVYFATRHATSPAIKTALWGFLALFAGALLLESTNRLFEYVMYAASAGLVLTHLLNLRQHRQHAH